MRTPILALAAGLAATSAAHAIPPFTTSIVHGDGDFISDFGVIGSPGVPGFLDYGVRNDGTWLMQVQGGFGTNPDALLTSEAPFVPYLVQDRGQDDVLPGTGFLTAPTSDHVPTGFHRVEVSHDGRLCLVMSVGPAEFTAVDPTSGIFLSRDQMLLEEGDLITAPGLAAGTVWNPFNALSQAKINDNRQILVISTINESGTDKTAAILVSFDAGGAVTGHTLIAKVGGPVGAGPDTWTEISTSVHASALNNAGQTIISGRTSGGVTGLYKDGAFVARTGDPTPDPNFLYGDLFGVPVDLNNSGQFAFRCETSSPDPVWSEQGDAGENANVRLQHNITRGDGPLARITGSLSDDHDVDLYRFFVDDPANFTATTVPGGGSAGAAFDTVLHVFRGGGSTPGGVLRNDDDSAGVSQSTITGAALSQFNASPREYVLAVSTRRATPGAYAFTVLYPNIVAGDVVQGQMWDSDPSDLEIHNGIVYWVDHGAGAIKRATTAGAPLADIPTGAGLIGDLAIDGAGGKLYFVDADASIIKRANLDGSATEDIFTTVQFPAGPSSGAVWGIAADTNADGGKVYWTRGLHGEINRADLDGSFAELVLESTNAPAPDRQIDIRRIAIDAAAGKLYWAVGRDRRITRANLDGTGLETILTSVDAADIALDLTAGKIYWTETQAGAIKRANLDGTGAETLVSDGFPAGLAVDTAAGMVYWSDPIARRIRRAAIAAPTPQTFLTLDADTAQRRTDGLLQSSSNGFWTRWGAATPGALPYEIRLEGASFSEGTSMVVKNAAQVVAKTFDVLPDLAPNPLLEVGAASSPVHISDNGNVIYYAFWDEPTVSNAAFSGLLYDQEVLVRDVDTFLEPEPVPPPQLGLPGNVIFVPGSTNAFDLSDSGEYLLARINHFTSYPLIPFAQKNSILLFQFEPAPPACACELTGDSPASVDVFDLLAYLALWFPADPGADIDGTPGVDVFDLLFFLNCWFPASAGAPCP